MSSKETRNLEKASLELHIKVKNAFELVSDEKIIQTP